MYNTYQQGGYPQGGQRAGKKKDTPINKVELTGIVKPRGNFPDIKVREMPNGGATVKFSLECKEVMAGSADANGNPRVSTTYVPVSVWANKIISVSMLHSIVPGMKVHVVGRWRNQHFKDQSGVDKNFTECEAYVLEIQEQPMAAQAQGPAYGQQYPGYAPQPQYPAQQQYPTPQPQAPAYGQQYPGYAPQPAPQAPMPQQAPPYYQQPQQPQPQPYPQYQPQAAPQARPQPQPQAPAAPTAPQSIKDVEINDDDNPF